MRPLSRRDRPQLQGLDTVNPTLACRNMPIRNHYPHFAVHHDRPISVSSLDRRRGREKLSRKERRSSYEEGGAWLRILPSPPVRSFRQTGRLAHSRSFPSSGVSAANTTAGAVQLADPPRNESLVWSCCLGSAQGRAIKTDTTCATARGKLTRNLPTRHPPAASRAQIGRSQARGLEAFLRLAVVLQRGQALSTASLSPERAAVRGGDGATTRQIARGSGCCRARNSANARQTCEGISITADQLHRSWRGGSSILTEAAPHLAGAVFLAAAWPIREAWWEWVGF